MKKLKSHSSLLTKYTLMYEKKPRSRVFAPLAETYRKLGMLDEAMKILSQGIKIHPTYTLGYIVLGHCYYDQQNYEMAYSTVRPFVSQNLENITLQKLFAQTCINLGYLEEALQTFKYLLLLNPKDKYIAEQIKLLEDDLLIDTETDVQTAPKNIDSSFDEDEWVQVDFNSPTERKDESLTEDVGQWSVEKSHSPLESFKEEIKKNSIEVRHHDLDDEFFHEDYDKKANDVITPEEDQLTKSEKKSNNEPIITHTLVDLYCKQGHYTKAVSILENILELHPDDKVTQQKLDEIVSLMAGDLVEVPKKTSSVNLEIIDVDEKNQKNAQAKYQKIEQSFEKFMEQIKLRSAAKLA
ncbi:MAG: CDC27 family protein [Bacteriovoracaceae bacterium]|jgi:tetratricopeptide (TPR) repeat protein|nr:CDC27 family protein [Bacteriovoracaceae bacterium]